MWSRPCHAYLIASCLALVVACGPAGGEDNGAPAFLAVEPDVLEFGADEDTRTLLVKNTGGEGLSYAISVTAQSAGVVWLEVDPKEGVVEGGGARSILVRVINRDSLQPGTYTGQVTVEAESLDSVSVDVSMTIGQPILSVDLLTPSTSAQVAIRAASSSRTLDRARSSTPSFSPAHGSPPWQYCKRRFSPASHKPSL